MARLLICYTYDVCDIDHYIRIIPELQLVLYHPLYLILRSYESYPLTCTTP